MKIMRAGHTGQRGITIVELLVVIVMIGLFTTIIMNFTIGYWRYGYLLQADLETLTTRLNAGDFIRGAIGPSSGLIIQNSIADGNTNNPDASIPSGENWIPIHAIPGNKPVGATGTTTPLIYFRKPSVDVSGAIIMNGVQPYEDEFVFYLDGTTKSLRQRTLANPGATGNKNKTSCPVAVATTTCPPDKIIATDLSSIDMRYFSRTGAQMDYTSIYDSATSTFLGPDFTAVEVVEFNLNIVKKPFLQKTEATSNSTIIRVALRNA